MTPNAVVFAEKIAEIAATGAIIRHRPAIKAAQRAVCRGIHLKQCQTLEAAIIASLGELWGQQVRSAAKRLAGLGPELKAFCPTGPGGGIDNSCGRGGGKRDVTASPEFRAWFGNSKVVDENGKPLVVYHGTRNAGLTEFDPEKLGAYTGAESAKKAFFFSDDPEVAGTYPDGLHEVNREDAATQAGAMGIPSSLAYRLPQAEAALERAELADYEVKPADGEEGFEVHISEVDQWGERYTYNDGYIYENKVEADDAGHEALKEIVGKAQARVDEMVASQETERVANMTGSGILPVYLKMENPLEHDFSGGDYRDQSFSELIDDAIADGHDGVILRNVDDAALGNRTSTVYAVLSPTQIKSASGNDGTFDPNDPNITKAFCPTGPGGGIDNSCAPNRGKRQTDSANFQRWFEGSKVVDGNGEPLIVFHGTTKEFDTFQTDLPEGKDWGVFDRNLGAHFAEDPSVTDAFNVGQYRWPSDFVVSSEEGRSWYREHGEIKYDGTPVLVTERDGVQTITAYNPKVHGSTYGLRDRFGGNTQLRILPPGGQGKAVYLAIKNPLRVEPIGRESDQAAIPRVVGGKVFAANRDLFVDAMTHNGMKDTVAKEMWETISAGKVYNGGEYMRFGSFEEIAGNWGATLNDADLSRRAKATLEELGYDGIAYKNTSQNEVHGNANPQAWIAFHPQQVKSATGNSGAFDSENPDSTKAVHSMPIINSAPSLARRIFNPREWDQELVNRLLPLLAKGMVEASKAQLKVMGQELETTKGWILPGRKAFCPTGPGGGVDPTCSPHTNGGGSSPPGVVEMPLSAFTYHDKNDEFLYHISPVAAKIVETGVLRTGKQSMDQGFYRQYSKGKVFFTERSRVKWWADRIEQHLEAQHDDPPALSVVRIPRELLAGKLKDDEVGNKDDLTGRGGSYYVDGEVRLTKGFQSTKATTATEWLSEQDALTDIAFDTPLGDASIRLGTEYPDWMKKEIQARLSETFSQPYWKKVNETTQGDIEKYLREGLENGWSIERMAHEMAGDLDEEGRYAIRRGRNIARTEMGNSLNGARTAAIDGILRETGVVAQRTWMSVLGNTTRAAHANLDGVPCDENGMWNLNGVMCRWPGDVVLPASDRCSCQCSVDVAYGMQDDEADELRAEYELRAAAQEEADNEKAFCPTGPGGGVDNSCGPVRQLSTFLATKRDAKGKLVLANGDPLPKHLPKIPPAWVNVQIASDPKADLQVRGEDSKGRTIRLYNETHATRQAAKKFAKVNELRKKADEIKKEIQKDIGSRDHAIKENAACLYVIQQTGIRPGSDTDTKAAKQAYGATTLEGRHVVNLKKGVHLRLTGKKGVDLDIAVKDAQAARILLERKAAAGPKGKLFDTTDEALREYSQTKDGGGFNPKDFRTARGTSLAVEAMKGMVEPKDAKEYKKAVKAVATVVAKELGNTPTIALQSYISPEVFAKWRPSEMKAPAKKKAFCPTGPGGGVDNSCSPFAGRQAVGFKDDPWEQYPDAPNNQNTKEQARVIKNALKEQGRLNSDGTVSLYHVTVGVPDDGDGSEHLDSILKHGLVPAAEPPPGQTWDGTHNKYATYFHSSLDAAQANGEQSYQATIIEARIPITAKALSRILPDEEVSTDPEDGLKSLLDAMAVVVVGGVPATNIRIHSSYEEGSKLVGPGDEIKAFCPTGPGGGVDNSCSPNRAREMVQVGDSLGNSRFRVRGVMGVFSAISFLYADKEPAAEHAREVSAEFDRVMKAHPGVDKTLVQHPVKSLILDARETVTGPNLQEYNGLYNEVWNEMTLARVSGDVQGPLGIGGYVVDGSMAGTARHELGHHVQAAHAMDKNFKDDWTKVAYMGGIGHGGTFRSAMGNLISGYAATNSQELFAESFCAYTHPDYQPGTLPKLVERFMDKHIGRKN